METGPSRSYSPGATQQGNKKYICQSDRTDIFYDTKSRTEESIQRAEKRLIKRQEERKRKLAEVGIKYDFNAIAYVSAFLPCFASHDR